jgi:hypothetical protein
MKRQLPRLFLAAVLLALPALACNFVTGMLEPSTPPSAQPVATATIEPTPTSLPDATDSLTTLTTYDNEALGLSFQYPQSWDLVEGEGSVTVASNPELLTSETFDREGAGVAIAVGAPDEFEADSPEDALLDAVSRFGYSREELSVETFNTTTINGQEATVASIRGDDDQSGQTLLFYTALLRQEQRVAVATGITLEQYADQFQPDLETITNSIRIRTPATPEVPPSLGQLEYGQTVQDTVQAGVASAWQLTGEEGERIDIRVTPLDDQLDVTVDVLDESGVSILPSGPVDDAFGMEEVRALTLPAGGEYLVVIRGFARSSGDYQLVVSQAGNAAAGEAITINQSRDGSLGPDQHNDYTLTLSQSRTVTILVNPVGDFDVVVEIVDEAGSIVLQEDSSFGREQVTFEAEAGAEYIIRLRGYAGASGEYTVSVTPGGLSSDDPGTTVTAVDTLPENDTGGHDFPFTALADSVIYASVVPEGELDVVVQIWNDDTDQQEEQIDLYYGREDVTFIVPETGNYYFKVLGFEGQGGDYTMIMSSSPTTIFELAFGDTVEGRLGEDGSIEYAVRVSSDEELVVEVEPDAETDAVLDLLDLDDVVLANTDEGFSGEAETLRFIPNADSDETGIYLIRVSDFAGDGNGAFALILERGQP